MLGLEWCAWKCICAPAEVEHPSGSNEQEASVKVDYQHCKDELTNLHKLLAALEGATQDSLVGMASSHNSIAFASSTSSSTWMIDLGAIGHVIDICSEFQSYTSTTNGRVRIANGSYNHIDGKGTVRSLTPPFFIICSPCSKFFIQPFIC